MRRMLTLILIVFTIIPLAVPRIEAQEWPQPVVSCQREVELLRAGLLTMNDTFTLEAPQGTRVQFTSIKVGFQTSFIPERSSFELWEGGGWRSLMYDEAVLDHNFQGFELTLPSPVMLEDASKLKIRASYLFANRVLWNGEDYVVWIPVYPATTYNISSFMLHVSLPEGSELKDVYSHITFTNSSENGLWTLRHEAEALMPLRNENVTITYTPPPEEEHLIDCELMERVISIMPNSLRLEDTYVITNKGATFNRFHLELPRDASRIAARDGVGPIKVTQDLVGENATRIDLYVIPRSSVGYMDRWSFTVEYALPRAGRIAEAEGTFTLTYPANGLPHYVGRLRMITELPEGGVFIASDPEPTSVEKASAFAWQAVIDFGGVTPSEHPRVNVDYSRSIFWSVFRPLQWLLIAAGAIGSVYILKRRKRVEAEKPAEAKRTELEEFLDLYSERVALLAERESLELEAERGEVSRSHLDKRSAEIARSQRDLLRTLRRLGRRIEAADPRMSGRLRAIREAEAELERENTALRNLEVRLRTRRISRRDHARRREEHLKRRSRARRRIERAIAALKAEA